MGLRIQFLLPVLGIVMGSTSFVANAADFSALDKLQLNPLMTYLQTAEDRSAFYADPVHEKGQAYVRSNVAEMLRTAGDSYLRQQQTFKELDNNRKENNHRFFGLFQKKRDPNAKWEIAGAAKDRKLKAAFKAFQDADRALQELDSKIPSSPQGVSIVDAWAASELHQRLDRAFAGFDQLMGDLPEGGNDPGYQLKKRYQDIAAKQERAESILADAHHSSGYNNSSGSSSNLGQLGFIVGSNGIDPSIGIGGGLGIDLSNGSLDINLGGISIDI